MANPGPQTPNKRKPPSNANSPVVVGEETSPSNKQHNVDAVGTLQDEIQILQSEEILDYKPKESDETVEYASVSQKFPLPWAHAPWQVE